MSIFDKLLNSAANTLKGAVNKEIHSAKNNIDQGIKNSLNNAAYNSSKTYRFNTLPETVEALKALPGADMHDPHAVAALTVLALCEYPKNRQACFDMLNYLKGPRPLTNMEKSFMEDRFMDGVDYIPRSYLDGTSPANDYTPTVPYTVGVKEYSHNMDDNENYLRLYIKSSGADSERFVDLRHKPSTNQWFLWEFAGLLSGIRIPTSQDAWA